MGTMLAPVRRRILAGAFIVGIAVALLAPVAAYATNTASFSSRTPASGAQLTTTRPSISVIVYDRYGVHGSGAYSMTVDGKAVSLSATYLVTGSWNPLHPNYNRLRLSGRPATALAPGIHRITVKIRDRKSRYSTSSWSFTVKAPVAFSTPVPASGSKDDKPRPAISVNAYAFNGAQGGGKFGMTVDGSSVTPVVSYSTKYTRFKVAAPALSSDLGVGVHTIVVKVTDTKGNTGSYQWSITVLAPPILPMPNTVSMTDCAGCHAGFPGAHPMTTCVACHSALAPPRPDGTPMRSYSPIDTSAHTTACATNPVCHRGGGPFPHVLGEDCARCHVGTYPGIPPMHSTSLEQYHQSGSSFCVRSGCHVASLTTEHYRRTVDGVSGGERLSCDTCHKSTDPRVRAAIVSHSTDCEGCHDFTSHTALHTVTRNDTCSAAQCHGSTDTNLITIHAGCAACHADTASATTKNAVLAGNTSCANCHGFLDHRAQHAVTRNDTCAATECHGSTATDLTAVHTSCTVCHGPDAPASTKAAIAAGNRSCANCHGFSDHVTQHAVVRSDACAATECHGSAGTSLTTIHSSCAMCHNSYAPVRTKAAIAAGNKDCANCHGFADHKALHAVIRNDTCAAAACHGSADTNLMTIHASCAVCHGPIASSATKSAIATGNTGCAHCHGFSDHSGLHAVVRNDSCAECHVPADTNLITIHKSVCATCHASGKDAVKQAIAAGRSACRECHAVHDFESVHAASPASQTTTIRGVDYGERGCSQCHSSLDLRTLHADKCSACHTTSVDTTLGGTWNKSCAQGGCHAAGSTKPFHGTLDSSHTVTAWPAGFSGCSTGSCHTGGTDVAAIHAPKLGCATCHGGDKVPTLACGSVGCHEKTHDLPAAHAASPASETITINSVDYGEHGCSECHSPLDLRNVHGGDDSCNTCHTASVKTTLGGTWNKSCVQGGCHTAGSTKPFHGTVDSSHTVSASALGEKYKDCTTGDCHSGGYDVAKIHAPKLGCATCHGGTKVPTLDCGTVGCHDKTHDLPAAHAASPASQMITINSVAYGEHGCSECHSPLDLRTLHANKCDTCHSTSVKTKLGGAWDKSCVQGGCHTSGSTRPMHATLDTSHTVLASALTEQFKDCTTGTCHTGGYDVAKIHGVTGGPGCSACHGGAKVPTLDCGQGGCHDKTHDLPAAHAAAPASQTITINTVDYGKHECSDCHTPLDLRTLHGVGDASCATCHTTSVKTTLGGVAWAKSCVQGGCHSLTSKKPMHATVDTSHTVSASAMAAKYKDCTTGTCHAGGYDVAKIHGVAGGPGCSACHGGTKVPTLDCGTVGCHADLNHTAKHDLPTPRADECIGCHAGTNLTAIKLTTGAVSAKHANCATCHAPAASSKVPTATLAAAIAGGHKECAFCHADLDHIAKHDVVVPVRTDACVDCHGGTNLTLVHDPARVSCLTCHGSTDPKVLVAISTHNKACAACHADAHQASHQWCNDCHNNLDSITWGEHGANSMPDQPCANCHGAPFRSLSGIGASHSGCDNPTCHDGEELGSPSPELHTVTRSDSCATCHPGTNLTMVELTPGNPSATHGTCATCHAPTSTKIAAAKIALAISSGNTACGACHDLAGHGPQHDVLARADDCIQCHPGTNLTKVELTPGNLSATHGKCATCHTPTSTKIAAKTISDAIAGHHKECIACHANAHQASHKWCNDCHGTLATRHTDPDSEHTANQPLVPGGTCSGCHGTPFVPLAGIGTSHPTTMPCTSCHTPSAYLGAPTPELHGVNRTLDTCGAPGCHTGTDLTTIRSSTGALAPKHSSCATCHAPTSTKITAAKIALAISSGNTACGACHDPAGHGPLHDVLSRGDSCVSCHAGTNLTAIKSSTGVVSVKHQTCATCHAPTAASKVPTATIAAAIAGGHKECSACHGTGHDLPALHAATPASATITINAVDYGKHRCSECHTPLDLRTLHGAGDTSCAKCHTTSVQTTLGGSWTKGCVQGDCHKFGTPLQMHRSIDTSHTTPASAQTNCSGATCHGVTLPTSVAALHAPYGGCPDCHAAGKTPSLVCSSCHAAHPDLYGGLHTATMTSANFTFNGVDFGTKTCSTCHESASLLNNHASVGACGACHPGIKTALGGTWTWNKTCTQGTCHSVTAPHPYHATVGNHLVAASGCNATGCHPTNVAYAHSRVGCGVCHAPGHKPLTTTCASCHGAGGTATRVDSVASHLPAHDYCNYCHLVSPAYDEHGGNPGRPIDASWTCANCHGTAGVSPRQVGLYDHGCGDTVYYCH